MSKFHIPFLFALFYVVILPAQQNRAIYSGPMEKAPYTPKKYLIEEHIQESAYELPTDQSVSNRYVDELVSFLRWDAQAYGCMPSRIYANDNGDPVVSWIFSTDITGNFPERGTGYSARENGMWPSVTARVETARTGFPAIARTADGTELIVSHNTGANPWAVQVTRKASGSNTWTEANIQNPPGNIGLLWPRIATGGPDGQSVHVIAITTPSANGGAIYEGVDAHLLYWRSLDGGQTWDINAQIIPGLDSSKYDVLTADSYTIDVNGNGVAIAVLPSWNDLLVFKSTDNGTTWEDPLTVIDFPDALENYAGANGDSYTFDDIGYFDPEAPDSLSIFSNDGFGALIMDDMNQAHLWFGRMYYTDDDPAEGSFYFPGTNGLMYWNETMGEDTSVYLTGALDYDGDTLLNVGAITEIGPYFNSLASFPTVGVDDDGVIYLCYSALHELYRSDWGAEVDQFYRHLYLMKSEDNGATWGDPYEITVVPYVDEFLVEFTEAVYPAIPRHIGDKIWVVYQNDAIPGTDIWGDNHATNETGWVFSEIEKDSLPVFTGLFEVPQPELEFAVSPNPATDLIRLQTQLDEGGEVLIQIIDLNGRIVRTKSNAVRPGSQVFDLQLQGLASGTYQVRLIQGRKFGVKTVVKN